MAQVIVELRRMRATYYLLHRSGAQFFHVSSPRLCVEAVAAHCIVLFVFMLSSKIDKRFSDDLQSNSSTFRSQSTPNNWVNRCDSTF